VVLGKPGDVESEAVGVDHLLDVLAEHFVRRLAALAVSHQAEVAEMHRNLRQGGLRV
jgi:hypothetical protein